MNETIKEAIENLKNEIEERENFIKIVENMDLNEKLNEEKWHSLCQTWLRTSSLMGDFLLNIFPEAEDVKVGCNYVYFTLYGIKCASPTSLCRGIEINTSWYRKIEKDKPEFKISRKIEAWFEYGEALKSKKSWIEKAKIRSKCSDNHRNLTKFGLFCFWFFKWKWEKFDISIWEEYVRNEEFLHEERVKSYNKLLKEREEKVDILFNKLIPTLSVFSNRFHRYSGADIRYDVEEIRKLEEIKKEA